MLKTEETLKISLKILIFKTATISLPFSIYLLSTEGKREREKAVHFENEDFSSKS